MKTTYRHITDPRCEHREHERSATRPGVGRSYCYITCPFCGARVQAFIWSLSGGGKRCPCGAIHFSHGMTYRMPEGGV